MAIDERMILHRRMRAPDAQSLHLREFELRLADDGCHLTLCRYAELYSHDQFKWGAITHHRVPLVSVIRWMIDNGTQDRA